ncbi:MAG: hypothetical protein SYC29_15965 [Planctomycetota bacterium]|nr:hypothetical protein [Planctomycetota bacterium]
MSAKQLTARARLIGNPACSKTGLPLLSDAAASTVALPDVFRTRLGWAVLGDASGAIPGSTSAVAGSAAPSIAVMFEAVESPDQMTAAIPDASVAKQIV